MKTRYPNVTLSPDRHGKLRARYRKSGRKPVYMKNLPDQPGFEAEYEALKQGPTRESRAIPRSVDDLLERYYRSADYAAKGGKSDKARRRGLLESFRAEFGRDQVSDFSFEHIEAILLARTVKRPNEKGRIVGGEVAAMSLRKQLRRLFAYAKKLKWIASNPVEEAERVGKNKIEGFHTWSEDEIAQFKKRHPLGSKARLALEIMLWTWQRRGDASSFGPRHVATGKADFTANKTGAGLRMMIAPDLRRAIDAMPSVGIKTFLVTEFGKPFTPAGFGNWFADRCDEAGLPNRCRAHGVRKAGARRAAEAEATQQGLKAVGGWKGDAEVATYTAAAQQEGLADATLARIISRFSDEQGSPNV